MPLSLNKLRTLNIANTRHYRTTIPSIISPSFFKHKALPNDHTKHHIPFLFPKAWHHSAPLADADVVPDLSWTSGRSELGRTSCSRVPRRWSACPRRRIPFFRNRRGYCCTNANVERSFMLEGLAGQAASTGRRTGSCCCSCKSAISVGEARWSGPLELPQCRTAPLHCPSASRQLLYTSSRKEDAAGPAMMMMS